jgi:hypothetical protein
MDGRRNRSSWTFRLRQIGPSGALRTPDVWQFADATPRAARLDSRAGRPDQPEGLRNTLRANIALTSHQNTMSQGIISETGYKQNTGLTTSYNPVSSL